MSAVIKLDSKIVFNKDLIQAPNLTDWLNEDELKWVGENCWKGYDKDIQSRSIWARRNEAGMDLAMQISKDKNFPWPGASNVIFPLITIAALQFSARSYANLIQGQKVVKYDVSAMDPNGTLSEIGARISKHMSWQVLHQDRSWEEYHDRLLINLAIVGTAFMKTWFSAENKHNMSQLVMASDLVIDYYAPCVDACARKTQVLSMHRNEIYEKAIKGVYQEDIVDQPWFQGSARPDQKHRHNSDRRHGQTEPEADMDTPFTVLEQHRLLDLDQDGYYEPYIVTFEASSKAVLRIVARVDKEEQVEKTPRGKVSRIVPTEYYTKYSFIPSIDGGIYDIGFGVLLGPLNEAVDSGINQLIDAGTMANSSGGFLGRGAKIRGGTYTMAPWEWKRVDSTGDDLRKNLVPNESREPSLVLFQLISLLIEYVGRISGSTDIMVGENPGQNTPATTSNNMIEQGMVIYSTIFKRVWRCMKGEFWKLAKLNSTFLPERSPFGSADSFILREDYTQNLEYVQPAADPKVSSEAQRIGKAQMVAERASTVPGYDPEVVERNLLSAMGIDEGELFFPGPGNIELPPDPRIEAEKMKMEVQKMKLDHEKWKVMTELHSQSAKTAAEIMNLEAQTFKIIEEAQAVGKDLNMKGFELAIRSMEAHQQAINDRILALSSVTPGENQDETGIDGGGLSGMEGASSDEGVSADAQGAGAAAEGAVG